MKIKPGILVMKGNFTQRQFDALGRMWDKVQTDPEKVAWSLPALQLLENGSIAIIQLQEDGNFKVTAEVRIPESITKVNNTNNCEHTCTCNTKTNSEKIINEY